MSSLKTEVQQTLGQLVGLPLSLARRAADMLILHFGTVREVPQRRKDKRASVGDFALHIQCPWRLENAAGILTGKGDLYYSAETGDYFDQEALDDGSFQENGKSLQDKKLSELLQGTDPSTGATMNTTAWLVVEHVEADEVGGAALYLSGGYWLRLFPAGSKDEHWRLFRPDIEAEHFVVEG